MDLKRRKASALPVTSTSPVHNAPPPSLLVLRVFQGLTLLLLGTSIHLFNRNQVNYTAASSIATVAALRSSLAACRTAPAQPQTALPQTALPQIAPSDLEKKSDLLLTKNTAMEAELKSLAALLLPALIPSPAPYICTMILKFPDSQSPHPTPITFQLAHAEMPYTALFFARQIMAGLWDGCKIIRNAGHVIQMDPRPAQLRTNFKDAGLLSVAFQEYNPEFPHVKHTLGLAGRPGGPDFYISIVDNTRNHGPGGQGNYDLPAEADPAFATITSGFHVVEKIHAMETKGDNFGMLKEFVEIVSIRIS